MRAMAQHINVDAVRAVAFGLSEELFPGPAAWHAHKKHQLLYAVAGTMHLETADGQWLLPPQRAAWIAAGVRHRVRPLAAIALRTIYVDAGRFVSPQPLAVFAVTPVLREMIVYAMRWGPEHRPASDDSGDGLAESFFTALCALSMEAAKRAASFCLPAPRSPELRRAVRYILTRLSEPLALEAVARAAFLSGRTLARRFDDELGYSFRQFLHQARMLRAMELLAREDARVAETAVAVGFESLGAFTRAFVRFTGERPRDFRKRGPQAPGKLTAPAWR